MNNFDEVIAERTLSLALDTGYYASVVVRIGKPKPVPGTEVFQCHYQFVGFDNDRVRYAEGADSMQALILAITNIGSYLYTSEAFEAKRLTSSGSRNLGFPAFVQDQFSDIVPDPVGLLII